MRFRGPQALPDKDEDVWPWFKSNRHWLEVHQLPPYSPELNPTERLCQHTRKHGTHNRFFSGPEALLTTFDSGVHGDAVVPATDPFLSGSFLLTTMSLYLCASI